MQPKPLLTKDYLLSVITIKGYKTFVSLQTLPDQLSKGMAQRHKQRCATRSLLPAQSRIVSVQLHKWKRANFANSLLCPAIHQVAGLTQCRTGASDFVADESAASFAYRQSIRWFPQRFVFTSSHFALCIGSPAYRLDLQRAFRWRIDTVWDPSNDACPSWPSCHDRLASIRRQTLFKLKATANDLKTTDWHPYRVPKSEKLA
jgi:hypothetical protein